MKGKATPFRSQQLGLRAKQRGHKFNRTWLWMAALRAVHMRENGFRDKYARCLADDPFDADRKRKALTAVAAKMARVVYAVIKTGTDYQRSVALKAILCPRCSHPQVGK